MNTRRLLVSAILAAAAYFAILGGDYSLYGLWSIERQHAAELERLDVLRDSLTRLSARADSLESDPATLERIARERYGLIRPGERLYLFVDPPAGSAPNGRDSGADGAADETRAGGRLES